jgi:predicted aspartyl protease
MREVETELTSAFLRTEGPRVPVTFVSNGVSYEGEALVDTGAETSSIGVEVVKALGLQATGSGQVQGVTGAPTSVPSFTVVVSLGNFAPIKVSKVTLHSPNVSREGIQAIIGRDVLSRLHLRYDGSRGEFALMSIDEEHEISSSPPIGKTLLAGLVFASALGALVWYLKPEPVCPPCAR